MSAEDSPTDLRDPWTWYYRFWAIYVALVQVLIGAAVVFGPHRWIVGNSAGAIHKYIPWVPWSFISGIFILGGLFILFERTRYVGYGIAFVLNTFFAFSAMLFTLFADPRVVRTLQPIDKVNNHPNPIVIGLSLYAPLVMIAGARYVLISRKQVTHG